MTIRSNEKVLVVGASGYLARFVVEQLVERGYRVTGFDKNIPADDRPLEHFIQGDITSLESVMRAVKGQEYVINLASLVRGRNLAPLSTFIDVMVKGTWLLAEACSVFNVKRFINISSIVATGFPKNVQEPLKEESVELEIGGADVFYEMNKWIGEEVCRTYKKAKNLDIVNIRPGVIAGDGENGGPSLPEIPSPHWFIYVSPEDVAQAIVGAVQAQSLGQTSYYAVADHPESIYNISASKRDLQYRPLTNWEHLKSIKG
jgi:nucleoside-diphosphate-sugar epimerase